jgi:hypothetical protein
VQRCPLSFLDASLRSKATPSASRGKVSGENGAAKKLRLPASTVEFRIKKLGIDKFRYRAR